VTARIADLRVIQAQRRGVVVGMPRMTAQRIAAIADFLGAASEWKDLAFMFDELQRHEGGGWKVPVDRRWWLAFDWTEDVGALNVRLVE
jgi:plasmid maintenance system killer protein